MLTIQQVMCDVYGVGLGVFDPISMLWASEKAAEKIGVDAAKAELKRINRIRSKNGLPVACHPFGHRLF